MGTEAIVAMTDKYLMKTYTRIPLAPVRGKGSRLWDAEGREYLDFVAGLAVNSTGHSHPKVVEAICKQASELVHVSNLYHIEPQAHLARVLAEHSGLDRAFFCNSGGEANEAALKLARRYMKEVLGRPSFEVITAERSFHGRTLATVTATAQTQYQQGFEPLPVGFSYVPFNDIDALKAKVSEKTCAVMLEPVQGEGGVYPADPAYLSAVRQFCSDRQLLLIFDEVQTGIGRTGELFAYQRYGVKPDIVALAKGLASGVPIGAILATEGVSRGFCPGKHASTFGGNFLACAAALATLDVILNDGVLENVREVGEYLMQGLLELSASTGVIAEVRGAGLMIGIELVDDRGPAVVAACRDRGLLINCVHNRVLRLLPPLVVTKSDADDALGILAGVLKES